MLLTCHSKLQQVGIGESLKIIYVWPTTKFRIVRKLVS